VEEDSFEQGINFLAVTVPDDCRCVFFFLEISEKEDFHNEAVNPKDVAVLEYCRLRFPSFSLNASQRRRLSSKRESIVRMLPSLMI